MRHLEPPSPSRGSVPGPLGSFSRRPGLRGRGNLRQKTQKAKRRVSGQRTEGRRGKAVLAPRAPCRLTSSRLGQRSGGRAS